MYQHYVDPANVRVNLARYKLSTLKAGSTAPTAIDERGKTTVAIEEPWLTIGPGSVSYTDPSSVVITGPSFTTTTANQARRKFTVTPNIPYTFSYQTTGAVRRSVDTGGVTTDPVPASTSTGNYSVTFTPTVSPVWVTLRWDLTTSMLINNITLTPA
jgi:hypothetical protein